METETKEFTARTVGKEVVKLIKYPGCYEMRPVEIILKEDGSLKDEPVFVIVMTHPVRDPVAGQISLEMLNEGLADIGYKLIKT